MHQMVGWMAFYPVMSLKKSKNSDSKREQLVQYICTVYTYLYFSEVILNKHFLQIVNLSIVQWMGYKKLFEHKWMNVDWGLRNTSYRYKDT